MAASRSWRQQERTALERAQEQRSVPDIPMPTPNPLTPAERAQVSSRAPTTLTVSPQSGCAWPQRPICAWAWCADWARRADWTGQSWPWHRSRHRSR